MPVYDMEEGVFYHCQRCTNCCQWPGEVVLTEEDLQRISAFLDLSVYEFVDEYTDLRGNRSGLTLKEQGDGATTCIFLEGKDCRIQPVKPAQCSGFPNTWNFRGWRDQCEAVPVPVERKEDRSA